MMDVNEVLNWMQQHWFWLSVGAGAFLFLLLIILILRRRKQSAVQEDDLYSDRYFDETPEENAFQGKPKKESRRVEREATPAPPRKRQPSEEQPLILVLFVTAKQPTGFTGSDIFSVLEELGCEYGKHQIFHHFGVGDPKAKQAVFSIADMLEPGVFDTENKENFVTEGLAIFMQLPGVFGGRVAFELMLNTTQRMAEMLEGQVCDERRKPLEPAMIDVLRERIAKFEQRE
ncbi:MAG: hypothetical protein RIS84_1557 [Pseudomonadota bacterium]|jgi:cell division protein ZipA